MSQREEKRKKLLFKMLQARFIMVSVMLCYMLHATYLTATATAIIKLLTAKYTTQYINIIMAALSKIILTNPLYQIGKKWAVQVEGLRMKV